ncbi:MAG TPA: nicotinamide mononucleotide transporter [Candidatus Saccharimonadales bacterium]|nr:nicotinamide mononucleotide transporter [Candidatus Saccharimonadales bacterium]
MNITVDGVSQVGLIIFGLAAIILIAKKNKWGFVIGLLSEPFFFATSYINKQWGLFILTIAYTFTWVFGIYEWFYKDKKKAER